MTEFLNLTQHSIVIASDTIEGAKKTVFAPSGNIARVDMEYVNGAEMRAHSAGYYTNPIPTAHVAVGEISGLPEPVDNTIYIVSAMVAQAAMRDDVLSPDTGASAIRNADGQIEAVQRLLRYVPVIPMETDDYGADDNEDSAF